MGTASSIVQTSSTVYYSAGRHFANLWRVVANKSIINKLIPYNMLHYTA
jgi:hypothetical protein